MVFDGRPSESLSNVDSAWLRMEDPTNLMTITGLLTFDEVLDFARLKNEIEDRLLAFDRFRQRVVQPRMLFGKARWEEDEHFALKAHLRRIALPHPADQGTLQDVVSDLMSTPLDYSKPLWQFHFVENYAGGCALIGRIHHCIGDGIALVRVMFSLFDEEIGPPIGASGTRRKAAVPPPAVVTRGAGARRTGGAEAGLESMLSPARFLAVARNGANAVSELGKLLALSADPPSAFKGKLGVTKRAAWSDALPLHDVKSLGKQMGATVNDVLLTGVTGALRRYLQQRGEVSDSLSIRAVVPVNLRPADEPLELGNRFGLVFLGLPVGLPDPVERLLTLKREMDEIKASPQAMVVFGVLNAIGMASSEVESLAVSIFGRKATAVMTNVPGPQKTLYLAGKPIRDFMFWVPQSGRLGLGVSIMSYAGTVRLGVAVDAGLVPDPGMIITHFHEELTELSASAAKHSKR